MKRIQYIILHVIAVFSLLTSCDLERNPLDKYAENAFWTDEEMLNWLSPDCIGEVSVSMLLSIVPATGGLTAVCSFLNFRLIMHTTDAAPVPIFIK